MAFLRVKALGGGEILIAERQIMTISGQGPDRSLVTLTDGTERALAHSADNLLRVLSEPVVMVK